MAKDFFLPVPLYLQADCNKVTNEMCGAACTQMVLHDIDLRRPFTKGEQDDLFRQIRMPPPGGNFWHNPPQGIRRLLNQQKPVARLPQRAALKPDVQSFFNQATTVPTAPYEFVIYGDNGPDTNPNPGITRAIG